MENVEKAEFILAHCTEALALSSGTALPMKLEDREKIFEQFAAKNIHMVVANPDFVAVEARALRVMPGKVFHLVYLIFMGLEHYSSVVRTG